MLELMSRFHTRIERVCLVDKPVDYSFLPDGFFRFLATSLPQLQVSVINIGPKMV